MLRVARGSGNQIEVNFNSKCRGLTDLVYRQKKIGKYTVVITQATAFL